MVNAVIIYSSRHCFCSRRQLILFPVTTQLRKHGFVLLFMQFYLKVYDGQLDSTFDVVFLNHKHPQILFLKPVQLPEGRQRFYLLLLHMQLVFW
jgi:hypothetical protein